MSAAASVAPLPGSGVAASGSGAGTVAPDAAAPLDFDVDSNAKVKSANLLVATQHNIAVINETVKLAADKFLTASDSMLTNGVEFAIRCWDPCLSCSTHAVGQMPLEVIISHHGTPLRRIVR